MTPLDPLGLPVFSATTPLAKDLTTHMGKGQDAISAQVSAMCEALERCSAEHCGGAMLRGSLSELRSTGRNARDPRDFELPDDSLFRDDLPITWVESWDLLRNEAAWLPLDLAVNPPSEGVLHDVDTNGLAAGNSHLEAIVHALCEVIERDALGQHLFVATFGDAGEPGPLQQRVDPETLPASCKIWVSRIREAHLEVEVTCINTEIEVPVFRSVLVDYAYPSNGWFETRRFVGYGASPNAELAALRAISEAVQSRVAVVQGARDSFNTLATPARYSNPGAYLHDFNAGQRVSFAGIRSFVCDDLMQDLEHLLDRLHKAGINSVYAIDLTRRELGMPVVRVRIPGLTSFAANRRRAGWRCLRHLL